MRQNVGGLTDLHEVGRDHRWRVTDALESYSDSQLRGIVGITLRVTELSAKAKLGQNRSRADRLGMADDLRDSDRPDHKQIAEMIDRSLL